MTQAGKIITGVIIGAIAVFILVTLVDVDVSGDLEVPEVQMTGGELPSVDVNTADIDVGTRDAEVEVPTDVNVETETRSIPVPTIDIDTPEENKTAEENDLD